MKSKKKLLISMLVVSFSLISVIATIAIVFALTQQRILTTLNITYVAEDIDGTASGSFTIGGVTEKLTAMKGNNVIGDKLVFKASDTEDAGNLMFPEDALALTSQNDNIIIQYTYSNTGSKHYIASMDFAANIDSDNMKVEYSINGTEYSEKRYAVVVPAHSSNKSYWIKISIIDKAKSASFKGDFDWLLKGCDEQSDDYLTIASTEFQATGTSGEYLVKFNGEGYLPGGQVVFPRSVNGDPVITIAQNSSLTQEQKNMVQSAYVPDSVKTIKESAFEGFEKLETITLEQYESAGASAKATTGLTTIGKNAFKNCSKLNNLVIPNTLTSVNLTAFKGCSNLTHLIVDNVNKNVISAIDLLSGEDYDGNLYEVNVTIGKNITNIPSNIFNESGGIKSLKIHDKVTAIASGSFHSWGLTRIIVDEGNTRYHSVGNCLIETSSKTLILGCKTSVIPADGSVTVIGDSAFRSSSITTIEIPACVTSIEGHAFEACVNLQTVTFAGNSTLTSIGSCAFNLCSNLNSIEIPASVTQIGTMAFGDSIESVTLQNKSGWGIYILNYDDIWELVESFAEEDFEDPEYTAMLFRDYFDRDWIRAD